MIFQVLLSSVNHFELTSVPDGDKNSPTAGDTPNGAAAAASQPTGNYPHIVHDSLSLF